MRGHVRRRGDRRPNLVAAIGSALPIRAVPLVLLAALAACGRPPVNPPAFTPGEPPPVRVALLVDVVDAEVGCDHAFVLADRKGILMASPAGKRIRIRRDGPRLTLRDDGGALLAEGEGPFWIRPSGADRTVRVGAEEYPGHLLMRATSRSGFHVINVLDLETYLRGVVPAEIGHADGYREAAKAQAVAARTYAVRHMNRYPAEGYDLSAGTNDQVFGSMAKRHPDADRAVLETRGLILTHHDAPIDARYASTCGGVTAAIEESFASAPVPYLISHEDDLNGAPSCRTSRVYTWEERWSAAQLRDVLARTVPAVLGKEWRGARIREVRVTERGESGRATRLRVETDAADYEIVKGAIRGVLVPPGGASLRSTWFELDVSRAEGAVTGIVARGRGWGHGVGMCQWGAMQLSSEGVGFDRILAHYYPGTRLSRLY